MLSLVTPIFRMIVVCVDVAQFLFWSYWDVASTLFYTFFPKPEKSIQGQTVLVTGAAHGLGHQLARKFASNQCNVVCWDVDQAANEASAEELRSEFPQVRVVTQTVDVSDPAAVRSAATAFLQQFNSLDILVNNAGIMPTKRFLRHSVQELRSVMDINVMSHMWTLRAFLPVMRSARNGTVVTICSLCGLMGSPSVVPYCASKYAVCGLIEALVEEERHFNSDGRPTLHYLTVYPFIMDTRMVQHARVRFPSIMPVLTPEFVADEVVKGVKCSEEILFFPKWMYPGFLFSRLWPRRMQQRFYDLISSGVDEQSFEVEDVQGLVARN